MQCAVLPHITASVFINDDEYGLHQDYEKWLEGLAPHAPIDQYWYNRMGEDACPRPTKARPKGRPGNLDRRRKRVLVKIIGE